MAEKIEIFQSSFIEP